VVLIFYRGGWCPYCDLHLRGFQRALPELQHFAAQIVAISPQLPDHSLSTQEKDELTFAVLSDVGNKVASQFGLVSSSEKNCESFTERLVWPSDRRKLGAIWTMIPAIRTKKRRVLKLLSSSNSQTNTCSRRHNWSY
jgi:peroxiredoxin